MAALYVRLVPLFTLVALASAACRDPVSSCDADTDYFKDKPTFEDALAITKLDFKNTYVDVEITSSTVVFGEETVEKFRLVRCGCEDVAPKAPATTSQVSVPPQGIYADDTVMLSMLLTEIDGADFVKAATAVAENAYTPAINEAAKNKDFALIPGSPQEAKSAALDAVTDQVDVAILNEFSVAGHRLALTGGNTTIPYLLSAETAEKTPLGRAEWVKFLALVIGRVPKGNEVYDDIKFRYNSLKEKAFTVRRRPSVFFNLPSNFSGDWAYSVVGGEQYMANFVKDANADYRFSSDGSKVTGSFSDAEVVKNFASARYWINMVDYPAESDTTFDSLFASEKFPDEQKKTWKSLAAVQCGNTWSNGKRITEGGLTNDFFEQAVVRPEKVLEDMLAIFHPIVSDKKPDELNFYYSLGDSPGDNVDAACPYNELPVNAPAGTTYKTFDLEVDGVSRFEVEDKLASGKLAPAIASEFDGVEEKDVEVFFEKPGTDDSDNTFASVRLQVDEDADIDEDKVTSAFDKSFPGTTSKVLETSTSSTSSGDSKDGGLAGGAIAGIAVGSLALLLAAIIAAFCCFKKRSRSGADMGMASDPKRAEKVDVKDGLVHDSLSDAPRAEQAV